MATGSEVQWPLRVSQVVGTQLEGSRAWSFLRVRGHLVTLLHQSPNGSNTTQQDGPWVSTDDGSNTTHQNGPHWVSTAVSWTPQAKAKQSVV